MDEETIKTVIGSLGYTMYISDNYIYAYQRGLGKRCLGNVRAVAQLSDADLCKLIEAKFAQPQRERGHALASMTPEKRREVASMGGKAAQAKGTAHRWTSEEAQAAGRISGKVGRRRKPGEAPMSAVELAERRLLARPERARELADGSAHTAMSAQSDVQGGQ